MGKGVSIISRYRTSDGQEFDTCSAAESHQRVLNWQATYTEDDHLDFGSTIMLGDLHTWVQARMYEHGEDGQIQFRANDMGDVSAYVRGAGTI